MCDALIVSFTTISMLLCVLCEDALGKEGESCADECRSPAQLCSTNTGKSASLVCPVLGHRAGPGVDYRHAYEGVTYQGVLISRTLQASRQH